MNSNAHESHSASVIHRRFRYVNRFAGHFSTQAPCKNRYKNHHMCLLTCWTAALVVMDSISFAWPAQSAHIFRWPGGNTVLLYYLTKVDITRKTLACFRNSVTTFRNSPYLTSLPQIQSRLKVMSSVKPGFFPKKAFLDQNVPKTKAEENGTVPLHYEWPI